MVLHLETPFFFNGCGCTNVWSLILLTWKYHCFVYPNLRTDSNVLVLLKYLVGKRSWKRRNRISLLWEKLLALVLLWERLEHLAVDLISVLLQASEKRASSSPLHFAIMNTRHPTQSLKSSRSSTGKTCVWTSVAMNGWIPRETSTMFLDVVGELTSCLLAFGLDNSPFVHFRLTSFCHYYLLGLESVWNIITPHGDAMLSCKVQEEPLILPANAFEMGTFLCGNGMERLLGYRVSTHHRFTCFPVSFWMQLELITTPDWRILRIIRSISYRWREKARYMFLTRQDPAPPLTPNFSHELRQLFILPQHQEERMLCKKIVC